MPTHKLLQLVPAQAMQEGAGVTIHRSIGTPALRHLDPFLMLDQFASDNPEDYIAGFPDHPHRGFVTFTYMLDGHMLHQDSMGNRGDLRAGGVQWMKAARGVIHSEMPQQEHGLMRGFQLWINLPAQAKMSDPAYQELSAEHIPRVAGEGYSVKLISGELGGSRGPIDDPLTHLTYLDVTLQPDGRFLYPLAPELTAFAYVIEGELSLAGQSVAAQQLAVLAAAEDLTVAAANGAGARVLLVAGKPIGEPIVQHGPFVMNTREEIVQAINDYSNGELVGPTSR